MQKPAAKKKVIAKSPWPSKGCKKYQVTLLFMAKSWLSTSLKQIEMY